VSLIKGQELGRNELEVRKKTKEGGVLNSTSNEEALKETTKRGGDPFGEKLPGAPLRKLIH